ncbi:hypothetical protein DFH29DRAFT_231260 [Suillus ampliporus]|nr:hypothetical protein DFH29DRAFT_231260 [Suillus ampliporus]
MSDTEEITTAEAPFDNPDCDVILRSTDGVNFHVFKLILSLASPVFKDMFTLPQNTLQSDVSSVPVIPVSEDSTTIQFLLLLCYPYPAPAPTFDSLNDAKAVVQAAMKYDMQANLSRVGDLIIAQLLPQHTLDIYALFCQVGWQHHAQIAATKALEIKDLGRPSNGFDGMRDITVLDYHRLLVYHYECGVAAQALSDTLSSWLVGSSQRGLETLWYNCRNCKGTRSGREVKLERKERPPGFDSRRFSATATIIPWLDEYLDESGKELFSRPCESTLRESENYNRAIITATECSSCRTTVVQSMDKFRALYIAQVDKVRLKEDL